MKARLWEIFTESVSTTTIANCLQGSLYLVKFLHKMPINMNNVINKEKRKVYVTDLMAMMRLERQVFLFFF